jgi:hypothetical protein
MNEIRNVKKIFEEKLGGRGRPTLRWIDDLEDDLRNMGIERWRIKALDRVEWASIIKEAKAKPKGPYCYRKKKKKPKHYDLEQYSVHSSEIQSKLLRVNVNIIILLSFNLILQGL